jgi:hypothetical protein
LLPIATADWLLLHWLLLAVSADWWRDTTGWLSGVGVVVLSLSAEEEEDYTSCCETEDCQTTDNTANDGANWSAGFAAAG